MDDAVLVFDDDCGFCTYWTRFVKERSDLRVVGFSGVDDDLAARLPENYESCAHLVTDDAVYSCGAAMEEAFVRSEICRGIDLRGPVEFLRTFEDYNRFREVVYRWVADHRGILGRFTSADSVFREGDGSEWDEEV
jgi:predicted DCC family thiol-disulfide oxidoreductase YuxK